MILKYLSVNLIKYYFYYLFIYNLLQQSSLFSEPPEGPKILIIHNDKEQRA